MPLKMFFLNSSHFLGIKSSRSTVDQLPVPQGHTQKRDDNVSASEEKVFLRVTASQNGSSRWRIRKKLQFASSCCRRSPSFAEANATIKALRTLLPLTTIPVSSSYFLSCFGLLEAQKNEIKLRSGHTTHRSTCHDTMLSCHIVSLIGSCA